MSELTVGDFAAFFREVHGVEPFPWQSRLLETVVAEGRFPALLDLPTGSGKTAAIDVALFHLALDASNPPTQRRAPRRIVMVVDRRTIVDQAFERARHMARKLLGAKEGVLGRVAASLRSLTSAPAPLAIAQLRGGMSRDDAWAAWPCQPLVVASTVDQVGSRLLFRGYGVSEGMRPIHAGLFGNDSLLLLDEVHLSEPFRQTLSAIETFRGWSEKLVPERFQVAFLSATPGVRDKGSVAEPRPFRLDAQDRADLRLSRRLSAKKPFELPEPVKVVGSEKARQQAFAAACAEQAVRLARPGRATLVVVNRVATARMVFAELSASSRPALSTLLVTGRMRPLDRDDLDGVLKERIGAGRPRERDVSTTATIVVATQCVEAGADYDVDGLITECASLDALRQRFGRLNRLGEAEDARAVILVRSDQVAKDATDPIYGGALASTWNWLRGLPETSRDFGIDAMAPAVRALEAAAASPDNEDVLAWSSLLSPRASAPVMLPSHLNLWTQTKPTPVPDPDVSLWLHGIGEKQAPEVQVVWRADLNQVALEAARGKAGVLRALLARLEVAAPVGLEALSLPLYAVKAWLEQEDVSDLADVEADARSEKERDEAWRDRQASKARPALRWSGDESRVVLPHELAPGDTLVVPSEYGGLAPREPGVAARGSWDPTCAEMVPDLGDRARFQRTRKPTLRLHPALLASPQNARKPAPADSEDPQEADLAAVSEALSSMAEALLTAPDPAWLVEALPALVRRGRRRPEVVRLEAVLDGANEILPGYLAVLGRKTLPSADHLEAGHTATTEGDAGSYTGVEVSLTRHLAGVAELAQLFAASCGLSELVSNSVGQAAAWHDIGKVDPRFQRLLRGGAEVSSTSVVLAKGARSWSDKSARERAQERSGYPKGERHELSSLALLRGQEQVLGDHVDVDLIKHLVASHHGHCRPFAPVVRTPGPPTNLTFSANGITLQASTEHGLERLESEIPERFFKLQKRYGWFGLAWLEAILRLADHRRSEQEQALAEASDEAEQTAEERA